MIEIFLAGAVIGILWAMIEGWIRPSRLPKKRHPVKVKWRPFRVTPIRRNRFLKKRRRLGNPYGYSYDRVKAALGDPDYVEAQGSVIAASWRRPKYSITLGFDNGTCTGVISEQS